MNIFEILSSGSNGLSEVHTSAVLGWLLDPDHDHGLGMEVLKRIVSELFKGTPLHEKIVSGEYSGVEMDGRRRINTSIELEKEVCCQKTLTPKNRSIDIVVKISDEYILAIENKIRSASKEDGQVSDEICGLIDAESKIANANGIYFIYLVKQEKEIIYADGELEKSPEANKRSIAWISDSALSMSKILQGVISDHIHNKINPIPSETLFLLRSFVRFVENGFTYYLGQSKVSTRYTFDDLKTIDPSNYVGFQGGVKALENSLKDHETLIRLLDKRPYKISVQKPNENWIQVEEFLSYFKKLGIPSE
jgi:hypothetical protein